jgi:hypothetical protein
VKTALPLSTNTHKLAAGHDAPFNELPPGSTDVDAHAAAPPVGSVEVIASLPFSAIHNPQEAHVRC